MKSKLVLSNGTVLSSGVGTVHALQQVTVTHAVNSDENLTVGSVCAGMLEATVITPGGGLSLKAGEEVTLYREQGDTSQKIGVFILEKPSKVNADAMKLTAFDRVTKLDKDLTLWLAGLDAWPYTLFDMARMVCAACGVTLENEEIPNGDFLVQKFSADGVTGRELMRWIGQAAGRFCIATADGDIRFDWYKENTKIIGNDYWYYQSSLQPEDYVIEKIAKVHIRKTAEDIGTCYPDVTGNTYVIEGNPLLAALDSSTLLPVAQTLYEQLKDITYTPCKVTIPSNLTIHAGDIVTVTDANGRRFQTYVMTKQSNGSRDILQSTGAATRESTLVVNNKTLPEYMGKVLNLKMDVDGAVLQVEKKISSLQIGGRNLIRNSNNLVFEDYYFTSALPVLTVTHDGKGNVTLLATGLAVTHDGEGNVFFTSSSITATHDGAGNVTLI